MKLLDLFAGRGGWWSGFLERGWDVVAYDLTLPNMPIPAGVDYRLRDILTLTPEDIREINPDFICASSPCEKFSLFGMKHWHPNPPFPEIGLALFNHARMLCETSGIPFVMENVKAAQKFVGNATICCGPFALWGTGVPPLIPQGIKKGISIGSGSNIRHMSQEQKRLWRKQFPALQCSGKGKKRKAMTAVWATIPSELSSCVADYAERITEQEKTA